MLSSRKLETMDFKEALKNEKDQYDPVLNVIYFVDSEKSRSFRMPLRRFNIFFIGFVFMSLFALINIPLAAWLFWKNHESESQLFSLKEKLLAYQRGWVSIPEPKNTVSQSTAPNPSPKTSFPSSVTLEDVEFWKEGAVLKLSFGIKSVIPGQKQRGTVRSKAYFENSYLSSPGGEFWTEQEEPPCQSKRYEVKFYAFKELDFHLSSSLGELKDLEIEIKEERGDTYIYKVYSEQRWADLGTKKVKGTLSKL